MKDTVKLSSILSKLPKPVRDLVVRAVPGSKDAEVARVQVSATLKSAEPTTMRARAYISTRLLDRDGEIVTPTGWRLDLYEKMPRGLLNHDHRGDPIYKAVKTEPDDFGLLQDMEFNPADERSRHYFGLMQRGFINTFSAGFLRHKTLRPNEDGFADFIRMAMEEWPEFTVDQVPRLRMVAAEKELIEASLVNIPSNPGALLLAIGDKSLTLPESIMTEMRLPELAQKMVAAGTLDPKCAAALPGVTATAPAAAPPLTVRAVAQPTAPVVTVAQVITEQWVVDRLADIAKKELARRAGAV